MNSKIFVSEGFVEGSWSAVDCQLMKSFRKHDVEAGMESCGLLGIGLKASSSPASPTYVIWSKMFIFLSHWSHIHKNGVVTFFLWGCCYKQDNSSSTQHVPRPLLFLSEV